MLFGQYGQNLALIERRLAVVAEQRGNHVTIEGSRGACEQAGALRPASIEAKMGPENVVKATVYLADMADFSQMNEVYARYLGSRAPARTTIAAAGLPRGVRVEIDVIAAY